MDFTRDLTIIRKVIAHDTAMAEADADQAARDLETLAAATDEPGFLLDAMKLFAAAGNGHTRIIPNAAARVFPLRLIWARDGLWAVDGDAREVAAINDVNVSQIFSRLRPFLAGTPQRQKVIGGLAMAWPRALERAGVPQAEDATFRFADGGARGSKTQACQPAEDIYPVFETGFPDPATDPYDTGHPDVLRLASFTTEDASAPKSRLEQAIPVLAQSDTGPLIVDLRGNPGGDFLRHLPILDALAETAKTRPIGVLVDRFTFSAAIVFAALCHRRLDAPIIGETMGDTASFHAEGGTIALPDSGAHLRWSDGYHDWQTGKPRPTTPREIADVMEPCGALEPALGAVTTPADLATGHDPALDAAFRFMKGKPCAP